MHPRLDARPKELSRHFFSALESWKLPLNRFGYWDTDQSIPPFVFGFLALSSISSSQPLSADGGSLLTRTGNGV
jgi:hypothetical protein